ncbi:MAG TPA: hypothetical protein PKA10_13790 [Selenomonadales bacterium]|nr:hypothetical protein [Selenomonadales bacterium]
MDEYEYRVAEIRPGHAILLHRWRPALGDLEPIAPAVKKGNEELLDRINAGLKAFGKENFIRKADDAALNRCTEIPSIRKILRPKAANYRRVAEQ